jgi:hypothetical protein
MSAKMSKSKTATKGPRRQAPKALALREVDVVEPLVDRVVAILEEARAQVVRTVNSSMVIAYWHIGRAIVEFVQRGAPRAEYGEHVLDGLSASLRRRVGRDSLRNLRNFRAFYHAFADREPVVREAQDEFGRRYLPNVPAGGSL